LTVIDPPLPTPKTPPSARGQRNFPVSRDDIVNVLLALNLIGLVGLGVRVYHGDKPTVVTVGITQMAREYTAKLATSNIRPEEARIRTQLFLAVAQDAVHEAATRKGILVVPRECVLAGEYADITGEVSKAVDATLDRKGGALSADAPPIMGGGGVRP
jgi:hypothetical protein